MEKQIRTGLIQSVRAELSHLPLTDKKIREFAFLIGGVLAALSGYWFWKSRSYWMWPLVPASQLFYFGLLWPKLLKNLYLAWMGVALVLGWIMTRVILTLFFYIVVTPMGLVVKASGGLQSFQRKTKGKPDTYWAVKPRRDESVARYEKQF